MSKKVLIFTYYWPPSGGIAVQRFLKFSHYLPQYGWEPIIVTVKNGSYPYYDYSLEKEINPSLRVYKTKTFEPFEIYNLLQGKRGKIMPVAAPDAEKKKSLFKSIAAYIRANYFIPDARKGWVPFALKQARQILKDEKIDAVITTGPPQSTHLIGLRLKKEFGIKWLADFRDPWTGIFYNRAFPRSEQATKTDLFYETEVLHNADVVTVIGPGIKNEFEDRAKRIEVIFNGYDEMKFSSNPTLPASGDYFVIRYVGSLLTSENAEMLWQTLYEMVSSGRNIRFEIIGRADEAVIASLKKFRLDSITSFTNFIPHREAIDKMTGADLLLYIVPRVENGNLIITGKIFEYIASKSEILSIGPTNSDGATILREAQRDLMLDYDDRDGINKRISESYQYWQQNKKAKKHTGEAHNRFAASALTSQLANLLNEISRG